MENKLETRISNSSQVFSVGQKQLICLARALLKKNNKFLVLDEATSNVDMRTDSLIQEVLKTKFKDTTVITIAHRLDTIADYDKIIVMSRQKVAEFGSPHELITSGGIFCDMVSHTGKNADKIRKMARQKYENGSNQSTRLIMNLNDKT